MLDTGNALSTAHKESIKVLRGTNTDIHKGKNGVCLCSYLLHYLFFLCVDHARQALRHYISIRGSYDMHIFSDPFARGFAPAWL